MIHAPESNWKKQNTTSWNFLSESNAQNSSGPSKIFPVTLLLRCRGGNSWHCCAYCSWHSASSLPAPGLELSCLPASPGCCWGHSRGAGRALGAIAWCSNSSSFSEPTGNVPWLLPGGLFQPKEGSTSNKNQGDGLGMGMESREGSAALIPPPVTYSGGLCVLQPKFLLQAGPPAALDRVSHGFAQLSLENPQGQGPTTRSMERPGSRGAVGALVSLQGRFGRLCCQNRICFGSNSLQRVTDEQHPVDLGRSARS